MSVSAFFGSRITIAIPSAPTLHLPTKSIPAPSVTGSNGGLLIECSSRPQKKATAHHMKTRPRKTQAWDIRRKPTVYAPLPPLPPDWTLVSSGGEAATATATATATTETSPTATE